MKIKNYTRKRKYKSILVFSPFLLIGPERKKKEKRIRDERKYELFYKEEVNKKDHGFHSE